MRLLSRLSQEVFEFESKLLEHTTTDSLDDFYVKFAPWPQKKLAKHLSFMNVPTYMSSFAPRSFPNTVVVSSQFIPEVSHLVQSTSAETLTAYFVVRAVLHLAPHIAPYTEPYDAVHVLLATVDSGKALAERQTFCLDQVQNSLRLLVEDWLTRNISNGSCAPCNFPPLEL